MLIDGDKSSFNTFKDDYLSVSKQLWSLSSLNTFVLNINGLKFMSSAYKQHANEFLNEIRTDSSELYNKIASISYTSNNNKSDSIFLKRCGVMACRANIDQQICAWKTLGFNEVSPSHLKVSFSDKLQAKLEWFEGNKLQPETLLWLIANSPPPHYMPSWACLLSVFENVNEKQEIDNDENPNKLSKQLRFPSYNVQPVLEKALITAASKEKNNPISKFSAVSRLLVRANKEFSKNVPMKPKRQSHLKESKVFPENFYRNNLIENSYSQKNKSEQFTDFNSSHLDRPSTNCYTFKLPLTTASESMPALQERQIMKSPSLKQKNRTSKVILKCRESNIHSLIEDKKCNNNSDQHQHVHYDSAEKVTENQLNSSKSSHHLNIGNVNEKKVTCRNTSGQKLSRRRLIPSKDVVPPLKSQNIISTAIAKYILNRIKEEKKDSKTKRNAKRISLQPIQLQCISPKKALSNIDDIETYPFHQIDDKYSLSGNSDSNPESFGIEKDFNGLNGFHLEERQNNEKYMLMPIAPDEDEPVLNTFIQQRAPTTKQANNNSLTHLNKSKLRKIRPAQKTIISNGWSKIIHVVGFLQKLKRYYDIKDPFLNIFEMHVSNDQSYQKSSSSISHSQIEIQENLHPVSHQVDLINTTSSHQAPATFQHNHRQVTPSYSHARGASSQLCPMYPLPPRYPPQSRLQTNHVHAKGDATPSRHLRRGSVSSVSSVLYRGSRRVSIHTDERRKSDAESIFHVPLFGNLNRKMEKSSNFDETYQSSSDNKEIHENATDLGKAFNSLKTIGNSSKWNNDIGFFDASNVEHDTQLQVLMNRFRGISAWRKLKIFAITAQAIGKFLRRVNRMRAAAIIQNFMLMALNNQSKIVSLRHQLKRFGSAARSLQKWVRFHNNKMKVVRERLHRLLWIEETRNIAFHTLLPEPSHVAYVQCMSLIINPHPLWDKIECEHNSEPSLSSQRNTIFDHTPYIKLYHSLQPSLPSKTLNSKGSQQKFETPSSFFPTPKFLYDALPCPSSCTTHEHIPLSEKDERILKSYNRQVAKEEQKQIVHTARRKQQYITSMQESISRRAAAFADEQSSSGNTSLPTSSNFNETDLNWWRVQQILGLIPYDEGFSPNDPRLPSMSTVCIPSPPSEPFAITQRSNSISHKIPSKRNSLLVLRQQQEQLSSSAEGSNLNKDTNLMPVTGLNEDDKSVNSVKNLVTEGTASRKEADKHPVLPQIAFSSSCCRWKSDSSSAVCLSLSAKRSIFIENALKETKIGPRSIHEAQMTISNFMDKLHQLSFRHNALNNSKIKDCLIENGYPKCSNYYSSMRIAQIAIIIEPVLDKHFSKRNNSTSGGGGGGESNKSYSNGFYQEGILNKIKFEQLLEEIITSAYFFNKISIQAHDRELKGSSRPTSRQVTKKAGHPQLIVTNTAQLDSHAEARYARWRKLRDCIDMFVDLCERVDQSRLPQPLRDELVVSHIRNQGCLLMSSGSNNSAANLWNVLLTRVKIMPGAWKRTILTIDSQARKRSSLFKKDQDNENSIEMNVLLQIANVEKRSGLATLGQPFTKRELLDIRSLVQHNVARLFWSKKLHSLPLHLIAGSTVDTDMFLLPISNQGLIAIQRQVEDAMLTAATAVNNGDLSDADMKNEIKSQTKQKILFYSNW